MFTYNNWEKFCEIISKKKHYCVQAMDIMDTVKQGKKFITLKHDVEANLKKALIFAKIENKYKIPTTFYIQACLLNSAQNVKILEQIKHLGHEIAYHYDVLDKNRGNWQKALLEFDDNIKKFEKFGFKIKTICPHGNPIMSRKGWYSNKDFFRNKKIKNKFPKIIDLAVGNQEKISKNYIYISDAGYNWQLVADIANNDRNKSKPDKNLYDLKNIIKLINQGNSMIISMHPHRWHKSLFYVKIRILLFKTMKICTKLAVQNKLIKKTLNKFYYLAKKI